ncbi:MAG: DUF2069 domain-containing protein [Betaproteobacteria bacterium]|nr:DUF2069 domain-containing protein [Betaproteobacteria bacterium]
MAEPLPSAAERPRTVAGGRWLRVAVVASAALTLLELLWEAWLAPLRPGGSWLVLKALPLALLWPAVARGGLKPRQVLAFALLPYFAEALVRGVTEAGRHALVAGTAAALAALAFAALVLSFRAERRARRR